MTDPLPLGATIGILGGGQLGRMLAVAASRLGFVSHIYEPAPACPAGQIAHACTTAAYEDTGALTAFAKGCDVVTYEFENVPAEALDAVEANAPLRPGRRALATSQDRLVEKRFLKGLGLHTAPFGDAGTMGDLAASLGVTGLPALLKTRRMGYDGKGQVRIATAAGTGTALGSLNGAPAIVEGMVPFDFELSVIVARGADGTVVTFDPGVNVHEGGILRTTTVPGAITMDQSLAARHIAGRIVEALDYIGVMGVELFAVGDRLLVNEIAPRVHNSGHWTQNGCAIDQFEQHIRAVAGWPLGNGERHADVTMENLIGDDITRVPQIAREGGAIHLYGKAEARPGRKMGHVNRVTRPAER